MNDFIEGLEGLEGLGGPGARLLEVHTVDPIPGTVTVQRTAHGTTRVECEVNLTSITPPRQIVLRLDQTALQRLAEAAANAAPST